MIAFETILILVLVISLVTLGSSAYGLGKESNNMSSPGYQVASTFTIISSATTVVSLGILISSIYYKACSGAGLPPPPRPRF